MNSYIVLAILLVMCESIVSNQVCPNVKAPLNLVRKRRHLAFPDGSNMALASQFLKTIMTHAPSGWNALVEIEVMMPLPNANFTAAHARRKLHHRQKKQAWNILEEAFNMRNLNGRACILKTICEAKVYLAPRGKSLVHDILRVIFTVPDMDEEFEKEMRGSHDELLTPNFCEQIGDCPMSILDFILSLNKPT